MKNLTAYQLEVLQAALAGNPAGPGPVDFDQLLAKLTWKPKKEAAQFTIRACITKGLLEKTELQLRRGRLRVCYRVTVEGRHFLDPRPVMSVSADPLPGRLSIPEIDDEPSFPDLDESFE